MAIRWRRLAVITATTTFACQPPPLDTTRTHPERGTLGEEIYGLFHTDFERETPRRAEGLALEKDAFVGAIDHLFPDPELQNTQDYLVKLLPLYDDSTIPVVTRTLAAAMDRLEKDDGAARALTALLNRQGYIDLAHEEALIRRLAGYGKFKELNKALIELALAHDGLNASGEADTNEFAPLGKLQAALAESMRDLEISQDPERDAVLLADLLLKEDQRFSVGDAPQLTASIVARDIRGVARVSTVGGRVPAPFRDAENDGLADLDESGRFVAADGSPLRMDPFGSEGNRDSLGRLVEGANAAPVFKYVNLENTLLVGLLRDSRPLVLDGTLRRALDVTEAWLGTRDASGKYTDVNNPLLDVAHAAAVSLETNDVPEILEVFRKLMADQEPVLGWNLVELVAQLDISDKYDVALTPGNTFFNDMMSLIRRILNEPGLAEDILVALENPAVLGLSEAQAKLSEYKHPLITEEDFHQNRVFQTKVDFNLADTQANQSLQQRLMHLIYDTRGARFEPEIAGIPAGFIFEINDLAEFYMLSIIGKAEIPSLVSNLTGLSERPIPAELAAFINEDSAFGNAVGNEGLEVRSNDGDTLFAASASGITDALKPLVQVFYDHGRLDLLFDLFEVLHLHWATVEGGYYQNTNSNDPRWSKLSGIRRYEPMLIDVFRNAKVLDAARDLLAAAKQIRATNGQDGRTLLLAFARRFFGKDLLLKTYGGASEVVIDGERISPLSPFDLVRYARYRLKAEVRRNASTQAAYEDLVDALYERFLEPERTGPRTGKLRNPRATPVTLTLLEFLEERARKHLAAGDLLTWIRTEIPSQTKDAITSDELPALIDMIHLIEEDEALDGMIIELRDELLDENRGFPDLAALTADMISAGKDASVTAAFTKFLGNEIHPTTRLTFDLLNFSSDAINIDPAEYTLDVMLRSLQTRTPRGIYAYGLSGAVRQANRINPVEQGPLSKADVLNVVSVVRKYLLDDQHGMEKFYELVENRK